MAIYHLNHGAIGRSTHLAGTAAAHARYIMRDGACRETVTNLPADLPTDRTAVAHWLDEQERADRSNARVIDKLNVAIPRELDADQRRELVREFCQEITQGGKVPYLAAIHDMGKDAENPHAHIILRDRAFEDGKRLVKTTERGSTERFREAWERNANQALERAGREERIDRRSLEQQGITDRLPTIHLGPQQAAAEAKGISTERGDRLRLIQQHNEKVVELAQIREELRQLHVDKTIETRHASRMAAGWTEAHSGALAQVERSHGGPVTQRQLDDYQRKLYDEQHQGRLEIHRLTVAEPDRLERAGQALNNYAEAKAAYDKTDTLWERAKRTLGSESAHQVRQTAEQRLDGASRWLSNTGVKNEGDLVVQRQQWQADKARTLPGLQARDQTLGQGIGLLGQALEGFRRAWERQRQQERQRERESRGPERSRDSGRGR